MDKGLYRDFNSYLRQIFGCRVQKIIIDAGLSCPNRDGTVGWGGCIYCNARGSGSGAASRFQSISDQLKEGTYYLSKRYKAKKFLAYFQSFSNTYGSPDRLRHLYEEALSVPDVVGLTIGTRPDCVEDEILDYLGKLGKRYLVWLEYGLQSADNATLARINRGHDVKAFSDAVERTRQRNLPICAHVILGLPGETRAEMLNTARFLATADIQAVKVHLLYVIRGTKLERWYQAGEYQCLSCEEYVSIVGDFLSLLPPELIIQRLTGDPHPEELITPLWALEKQANLNKIKAHMKSRGIFQGSAFKSSQKSRI